MLDLDFACLEMVPQPHAAGPTLLARLRIREHAGFDVRTIALRCQFRVDPQRRRYSSPEADRLVDLFGERAQWPSTMHAVQLGIVSHLVPAFRGDVETTVALPCTYDMEVACGKYFASLDGGEVPLTILFSGMAFLDGPKGCRSEPVPWHHEVSHRLPVHVWQEAIDGAFPGQGWLRVRRATVDALRAYAAAEAIVGTDAVVERLLKEAGWTPQ